MWLTCDATREPRYASLYASHREWIEIVKEQARALHYDLIKGRIRRDCTASGSKSSKCRRGPAVGRGHAFRTDSISHSLSPPPQMIPHVDARSNKNSSYPRRATIDDDAVRWSEESTDYAPDSWDAPVLAKFARPAGVYGDAQYWADPPLDAGVTTFLIWQIPS